MKGLSEGHTSHYGAGTERPSSPGKPISRRGNEGAGGGIAARLLRE